MNFLIPTETLFIISMLIINNEYNKKLDWNRIKLKETKSTSTKKINRNYIEHYLFYNFDHPRFDILDIL